MNKSSTATCQYADWVGDREFCHDESGLATRWAKVSNGKLVCGGNKHNCRKLMYHWLASLSEKERTRQLEKLGRLPLSSSQAKDA